MNFKKRVNGSWTDTPNYIHNTSTDTITTLPADIYPTGTTAMVDLKGNTIQNGTPTPDNPIMTQETGDLETVGANTGQYKIPISSANTTTPIYLGEVQTTRRVKKLVLTGSEIWYLYSAGNVHQFYTQDMRLGGVALSSIYSTIAPYGMTANNRKGNYGCYPVTSGDEIAFQMYGSKADFPTQTEWRSYLATQYAAGTPVTIWYVLAEPTTGIVNEPLRKIGDYADEVSGITIPTITGVNAIDVDTTLKPSEMSVNYHGWHPVSAVHEYDNNYTVATMQALTIAQLQTHTISELQGGEWS